MIQIRHEYLESIDSTNNEIKRRAAVGETEGLVISAGKQTAGRGRSGHQWETPADISIATSLLLRPTVAIDHLSSLTLVAAVAVRRAIEELYGIETWIKWPNDVIIHGKKVCGILTEAAVDLESGMLDYAVLGLGFNLVQPSGGWPKELAAVAGSLFDSAPAPGARAALAAAFLNEFWALYHTGLRGSWLDDYRRRQALTGRHVTLIPNGSEPRGATVLGIDDDCRLLVRCDGDLAPTAFGSDEIRVIPELGALA